MTKERLEEVLQNIIEWGMDHDDEFMECLVYAMDLSDDEVKELELEDYASEDDEDDEEEEEDDEPDLPDKVTLNKDVVETFDYDDGDVDDESLQECIDNYLSDQFGYCINDYNYKCHYNEKGKLIGIDIYNIDWDLSE